MSLIIPPARFSFCQDNIKTSITATNIGTNFTVGASNTDAGATEILPDLVRDCHYIVVGFAGASTSAGDCAALVDILIDRTGGTSWGPFIDDLAMGFASNQTNGTVAFTQYYHFPVWLPAGTAIAVQARWAHTVNSTSGRVGIWCFGGPDNPGQYSCGTGVETLGSNPGTSKGTNVTPGTSGAWGSWTTIGTSTKAYKSVQLGINGSDNNAVATNHSWQIGKDSMPLPGSPTIACSMSSNEQMICVGGFPIGCDVPASTVWQARASCAGASTETYTALVYGVY